MSSTAKTNNYNLPIFNETDKPTWRGDFNAAMNLIDTELKNSANGVAEAKEQVDLLEELVDDATATVGTLTARVAASEASVATIGADVTQTKSDIQTNAVNIAGNTTAINAHSVTISNQASQIGQLNGNLTAGNGVKFRFGYSSETKEYGYYVADSAGADTFFPFSNAKKLHEALQYSGFVTEDMTFDEICAVLAEKYPNEINILLLGFTLSGAMTNTSQSPYTFVIDRVGGYHAGNGGASTPNFDLTNYKTLHLNGTAQVYVPNDNEGGTTTIELVNASTGTNIVLATLTTQTPYGSSVPLPETYDVSNMTGEWYMRVRIDVNNGKGTAVINTARLSNE